MSSTRRPIKPNTWTKVPEMDDLVELVQMSQANQDPIVQRIRPEGKDAEYILQLDWPEHGVTHFSKRGVANAYSNAPVWTLVRNDMASSSTLWQHQTTDVGLIATLVQAELAVVPEIAPAPVEDRQHSPERQGATTTLTQVNFAGNLSEMDIGNLLQSLDICSVSGRLDINDVLEEVNIFFEDGAPIHAQRMVALSAAEGKEEKGESVISEVLTWTKGEFRFVPQIKTRERTVKKKLPSMLLEGATLRDQLDFLRSNGLVNNASLRRTEASLSEQEFEKRIATKIPSEVTFQKWLYQQIDGVKSITDIARDNNVSKNIWIPALFNLVTQRLVTAPMEPLKAEHFANQGVFGIDTLSVEKAASDLLRPETGLVTYPLFLHFLKLECLRSLKMKLPFSLIVFEINHQTVSGLMPLTTDELRELAKRIDSMVEPYDMLGHCQTLDYALLLPLVDKDGACMTAQKVMSSVTSRPLDPVSAKMGPLELSFGIAGIPHDGMEPLAILNAAVEAKEDGRKMMSRICKSEKGTQASPPQARPVKPSY